MFPSALRLCVRFPSHCGHNASLPRSADVQPLPHDRDGRRDAPRVRQLRSTLRMWLTNRAAAIAIIAFLVGCFVIGAAVFVFRHP